MINLDGRTLPWYLITALMTALSAVFYAVLRGKLVPSNVALLLREQAEKRADLLQATVDVNTQTIGSLVESVQRLMVYAESTDKILTRLSEQADRVRNGGRSPR